MLAGSWKLGVGSWMLGKVNNRIFKLSDGLI